jgi:hypothetical protein
MKITAKTIDVEISVKDTTMITDLTESQRNEATVLLQNIGYTVTPDIVSGEDSDVVATVCKVSKSMTLGRDALLGSTDKKTAQELFSEYNADLELAVSSDVEATIQAEIRADIASKVALFTASSQ